MQWEEYLKTKEAAVVAGKSWEDVKREADLKAKEADEHWQKAKTLGDNAVSICQSLSAS